VSARHITIVVTFGFVAHTFAFRAVLDLLTSGDVRVATHVREIDSSALAALKKRFSYDHRLADRGASFEVGDAISPANFPQRRLVLAAASGDTWFIHYEHGGIGLHSHLVALSRSGTSWRVVFAGTDFYTYDTLPKLRDAIRTHKFRQGTYEL
jgi:hypothetical protein